MHQLNASDRKLLLTIVNIFWILEITLPYAKKNYEIQLQR